MEGSGTQTKISSSPYKILPQNVKKLIFEQAACDQNTVARLALVSKAVNAWIVPILYTDVVITRPNQYLAYIRNFTFDVLKGKYEQFREEAKVADATALAGDRAGRPNPFTDALRTLTLHIPPPNELHVKLEKEIPALAVSPRGVGIAYTEDDFDAEVDEAEKRIPSFTCYVPIRLEKLTIHADETTFRSFKDVANLFNPTHFHLKSLEKFAMAWRVNYSVIKSSWSALEHILLEDALPLRPEQGDMGEGVAIPYMSCQRLRQITIMIRKFDHPAGAGIARTIFFEIPSKKREKLFKLEQFLIQITGKKRLAALQRRWEKGFLPMMKGWSDSESRITLLKMEAIEGPVGQCPDRVLSEDGYWYDRCGKLIGEAGSSGDESDQEEDCGWEDEGEDAEYEDSDEDF
ncbi:hypothetical protein HWV62_40248 [Athelia sp. TMB]|nr:hypothetical protein HWV62_40248 [Athelia sp. TMB]